MIEDPAESLDPCKSFLLGQMPHVKDTKTMVFPVKSGKMKEPIYSKEERARPVEKW